MATGNQGHQNAGSADGSESYGYLKIPRIYTGPDGRSHWGEIEIRLNLVESLNARLGRSGPLATNQITFREAPPECFQDLHPAPRRQLVITLSGQAEYTTGTGESRVFGPGGIFLADDTSGEGHKARGLGDTPRVSCYVPLPELDLQA